MNQTFRREYKLQLPLGRAQLGNEGPGSNEAFHTAKSLTDQSTCT
jgi:hypothetical protein